MNSPKQREGEPVLAWPLTKPDVTEVKEWIRSVLHDTCEVVGPTHIYAQYTDAPDIRVTARFEALPQSGPGVVFKANYFPLLASSPRYFHLLSQHCPGTVPHVLAWEERDGGSFLLYEAFEGELVSQLRSPDPLLDTVRTLAHIQTTIANLPESETNLLPCMEVARLLFLFGDVLTHLRLHYNAAWAGDNEKLTQWLGFPASQVLERLEPLQSEVVAWAQALVSSSVPLSIDHGDLHAGNARRQTGGTTLIYDWENACLSCPLFSVEKLLVSAWAVDRQAQDAGPWGWVSGTPTQFAVKQAYLETVPWGNYGERDHLFNRAMCLAVIKEMHQEIAWAETMDWANGNPEWTAQLISRLFQHRRAVIEVAR